MPTFRRNRSWNRWAASSADLSALASQAEKLVDELGGDTWLKIKINFPGEEHDYEAVSEFDETVKTVDLAQVQSFSILVSRHAPRGSDDAMVSINLYRRHNPWSPVANLAVTGTRRSWVDGATTVLAETMARHEVKRPYLIVTKLWIYLPVIAVLNGVPWYGIHYHKHSTAWGVIGIASTILGVTFALTCAAYWWIGRERWLPDLRLYKEGHSGDKPRAARLAIGSGKWLLTLVAGSLISFVLVRVL